MYQLMCRILLGVAITSLAFSSPMSVTNEVNPAKLTPILMLDHIRALQTHEKGGDELYLTLSIRPNGSTPTEYTRIPSMPDHWVSSLMNKVQPIELWSKPLAEGESVVIGLELDEYNSYEPDDFLGLIRIKIANQHGKLVIQWGSNTVDSNAMKHQFNLKENGANYEVQLSVKTK